jgi:HEAT repeat protein
VTAWADFRLASFGEPYVVWHDGPDFTEFQGRFESDPALATTMLAAGLAEGDALAAQAPRELTLSPEQAAGFVRLLTEALPTANAGVRLEAGATLFALTGSPEWSAPVVEVLASDVHWGVRIDAAMRLKAFPPTAALVAAVAEGVRDEEYLVRFHSANTLLRWAGRTDDISDDRRLFELIRSDATRDLWEEAARELVAAVER